MSKSSSMSAENKPRRFFGLLCAHEWERIGMREREWESGRTETRPWLRCKHCGDEKVVGS